MPEHSQATNIPIVVDLDGTLIRSDLLYESASQFIIQNPFQLLKLPYWLVKKGISYLKTRLAGVVQIDIALLPYNNSLIEWLRQEKQSGRKLVLATASDERLANSVAKHIGLFDEVFGSKYPVNLKSDLKRDHLVDLYGENGFDYVGNSSADLPIWDCARRAYIVGNSSNLVCALEKTGKLARSFPLGPDDRGIITAWLKELRIHQWAKNILVLVPLVAAHQYTDIYSILAASLAFLLFSLVASSAYVLNDLVDIQNDRAHKYKYIRPIAAGRLSILSAWVVWPVLAVTPFIIAFSALPMRFGLALAAYFLLTLAYSFVLKKIAILDVLVLACLYTVRIIAGAFVIGVPLSFWLISLSLFLFTGLAFIKRYSELLSLKGERNGEVKGRGYLSEDLTMVASMGISASYCSVLVAALYVQDAHTAVLYRTPQIIWLVCPILLYWVSYMWLMTIRGQLHEDPIAYALKDGPSWAILGLIIGVFVTARLI
jgi:4-hydroxybenzoate polyprenyltransferase/phosphoserine phosphatase